MLGLKCTEGRNRVLLIIEKPILYALLINILIRIPYFPHARGDDAFIVAWMAQAIQEGSIDPWTTNLLSLFGLYPYSVYPIGGLVILSIFFKIGLNIDLAFFLFSFLFTCISVVTTYYLGKLIFANDKLCTFFFVVFYTTSPVFLGLTYWTATLRGPFAAILPLTLYFLLKLKNEINARNIIYFIVSFILLALMHGLIIFFPVYFLSFGCAVLLSKFNILIKKFLPIFLISYICAFIIGISFLPINPGETVEFLLSNDSIVGIAWNLSVDYALKFGIISLLAVWGFLNQFSFNESDNKEMTVQAFFLVLGLFSMFLVNITTYTSIILIPWLGYFAAIGLKSILKWQLECLKYLIGIIPSFFGFLYSIVVIVLPIHLIFAALLAVISIIEMVITAKKKNQKRNVHFYVILCYTVIIFSRISVDGLITSRGFPFNYVSEDEFIVSEYLKKYNSNQEIIIVYDDLVARRIQAIGFQPVLLPGNYPANLHYGWISPEEIYDETIFDLSELMKSGIPFKIRTAYRENKMFSRVVYLDLRDKKSFETVNNTRIRYIVTSNPPIDYSTQKWLLFSSVLEIGVLRVESRYLRLYEIPRTII